MFIRRLGEFTSELKNSRWLWIQTQVSKTDVANQNKNKLSVLQIILNFWIFERSKTFISYLARLIKMNILKTQSRLYLLTPAKHFSVCCQNAARINHDDETVESPKSQNRNRNSKSLKKIYSEAWNFPSNHELLAHLADSVIHIDRKSGLVVINKPYGLALKPTAEVPVCLEKCLKEFSKVIGVKSLEVLKTAPRFVFFDWSK